MLLKRCKSKTPKKKTKTDENWQWYVFCDGLDDSEVDKRKDDEYDDGGGGDDEK